MCCQRRLKVIKVVHLLQSNHVRAMTKYFLHVTQACLQSAGRAVRQRVGLNS